MITLLGLGALPSSSGTRCIINLLTFGDSAAGEVFGVCACPYFYRGSTYACIMCTRSTHFLWSTYLIFRFDNIEEHMFYYLCKLRTNVPSGHFQ